MSYAARCTSCRDYAPRGTRLDTVAADARWHEHHHDGHRTQVWPVENDGIARPLPREMWAAAPACGICNGDEEVGVRQDVDGHWITELCPSCCPPVNVCPYCEQPRTGCQWWDSVLADGDSP